MIAPAVGLGVLVVFFMGFAVTYHFLVKIESKQEIESRIEARRRWMQGLNPSLGKKRINAYGLSIAGGIFAVILLLLIIWLGSTTLKVYIWYILTGLGILFGLLTFFLFREHR